MKKKQIILPLLAAVLGFGSCTKLQEKVLDESSTVGLTDKQVAEGTIAPAYAVLPSIFLHTNYFALQEISTDEAILPYRGGTDWGDNGIYIAMHTHNFQATDPNIRNTWNFINTGISRCITALNALPTVKDASVKTFMAEARAMRAYYNMLMLDLWGITFVKDDPTKTSKIIRGSEAVEYIKSELLAAEPDLESGLTQGRMSKEACWGVLARLYLNAAVYRDIYGTPNFSADDMTKVIEYCDKIIASPRFQFSPEYFNIFDDNNDTSKEIVFAVDQRADLNGHNRMAYFSLSGDQFPLPEFPAANGTDGPAITPEFYRSWVNHYAPVDPAVADPRFYKENLSIYSHPEDSCVPAARFEINRGILRGQQYGLIRKNGVFLKCQSGDMKVGPLFHDTRSKSDLPVIFTEKVDYTTEGSNYPSGYRVSKYQFSRKSQSGRNFGEANIVILRLADVYLMRAEAKLRKNNDASGALSDVNTVRAARTSRQPIPTLASIDLNGLFRERGFELYWECVRRTDMIRFGKYEGSWTEKTNADPQKRIFPIPQTAIDAAANIKDYMTQNKGY
jgi:hypothetical protein